MTVKHYQVKLLTVSGRIIEGDESWSSEQNFFLFWEPPLQHLMFGPCSFMTMRHSGGVNHHLAAYMNKLGLSSAANWDLALLWLKFVALYRLLKYEVLLAWRTATINYFLMRWSTKNEQLPSTSPQCFPRSLFYKSCARKQSSARILGFQAISQSQI